MKVLLIPLLISLAGCQSTMTVNNSYQPSNNVLGITANLTKDWYYRVSDVAMQEHQSCVDFALREMSAGEECKWQAPDAVGIVKIGKIESSGCHILLNTIYYKDKPKYFQENYCYHSSQATWVKNG
jgi:hypothetical protein|tara:strand:+ start:408 stop:785 length:378 start_codon:yes stop_codon:yes gene_type:complete